MEKLMHDSPKTNAIRQRMEEVRCDLDEGVQEIVEGARDMSDWRHYVRTYPWICMGAALAVGYLIVPGRPLGITSAELANPSRLLAKSPAPPRGNARDMLLTLLGNLVMRGVSSYAQKQAAVLFAPRTAESQQDAQP